MPLNSNLQKSIVKGGPKIRRAQAAKPWDLGDARNTVINQVDVYIHFLKTGEWGREKEVDGVKKKKKKIHLINQLGGQYNVNIKYMTESLVDENTNFKTDEEAIEWLEMFKSGVENKEMDEDIAFIKSWCTYRNKEYSGDKKSETPEENASRREEYLKSDVWKKEKSKPIFKGIEWTAY